MKGVLVLVNEKPIWGQTAETGGFFSMEMAAENPARRETLACNRPLGAHAARGMHVGVKSRFAYQPG
jgi:hypothetical protein